MVLMQPSSPDKISTSLAIQSLIEASEEVAEASIALARARDVRDALIRDAYDNKVPVLRLVRITGLSRERIYRITHSGDSKESDV